MQLKSQAVAENYTAVRTVTIHIGTGHMRTIRIAHICIIRTILIIRTTLIIRTPHICIIRTARMYTFLYHQAAG